MFKNANIFFRTTVLTILFSTALPTHADAFLDALRADMPSAATLEYGGDADDSSDVTLDFDIALPDGNRAQVSATRAEVHADSGGYDSDTWRFGLASDPAALVEYGISYESVERDDNVSADTVDAFARWRLGGFTLAAYPQLRTISLVSDTSDLRLGIRNPGIGLELGYRWENGLSMSARRDAYEYSYSLSSLDDPIDTQNQTRLEIITQLLLQRLRLVASTRVAQEFDIERNQLALGFRRAGLGLRLAWINRVSAIDHSESDTLEANASWDINDTVTVFCRYGRVREDYDSYLDYASGGVTVFWD